MTDLTRRTFIGLLGGALVASAVPKWPTLLTPSDPASPVTLARGGRIYDLMILGREPGKYSLCRPGAVEPILQMPLAKGSTMRWRAMPGGEIVLPQHAPSVELRGPVIPAWSMWWTDAQGDSYVSSVDPSVNELTVVTKALSRWTGAPNV
ncbi:MAG TPA: hypothetical protein VFE84_10060 [Patescibacteria group bacterium]|nr:hypothetical protein [Patescibacteria group bacterium]